MGLQCGIVGLPNVGKSTLFNAMTAAGAAAENYPFCTIEPNVGVVPVHDERLEKITHLVQPAQTIPTTIEFVDIAGLVKGASQGEGLGNQFLGHIRNVDAMVEIVRCFEDPDVVHVHGAIDPIHDIDVIQTELALADLDTISRRIDRVKKVAKSGDSEANRQLAIYERVRTTLEAGQPARTVSLSTEEQLVVREATLLTIKPILYVANVSEEDLKREFVPTVAALQERAQAEGAGVVIISGKIEAELACLNEEERSDFLSDLGLKESGLVRLARAAYQLLGLITFFTAGPKEVRAWTISEGTHAPQAAGVIHSDFEKHFIRAEVYHYDDLISLGSEQRVRETGKMRIEGKDYAVQDGDVIYFRTSA